MWGLFKSPAVFVPLLVLSRPFMRREIENTAPPGMRSIRSKVLRVWEFFSKAPKVFRVESIFRIETYYRDKMYIPSPKDAGASVRKFWGGGDFFQKVPAVFAPLWVLPSPFMHREIENTAPQGCEASG